MEQAHINYMLGHTNAAIDLYTAAIQAQPNPEAYYSRSLCYMQLGRFADAIQDLNNCISSSFTQEVLYKRGIAKFYLGHLEGALNDFYEAAEINSQSEIYNSIRVWVGKCKCEIELLESKNKKTEFIKQDAPKEETKNDAPIKEPPKVEEAKVEPKKEEPKKEEPPKPKTLKPIHTWYQNTTDVIIEFQAKGLSEEKVVVTSGPKMIEIELNIEKDMCFQYSFDLFAEILADQVVKQVAPKKLTLTLKKKVSGIQWAALEEMKTTDRQAYPSSKSSKNWDKIEKDIEKEIMSEKPEGDEAMMKLFKQIYERSDENTKKAMIKSYQTSDGTVLSTNWNEVKDKDYEHKDRPEAPKGQEWVKPS